MIFNQIFQQLCEVCRKLAELASTLGDMPQVEGLHMIRWCTTDEDGVQTTTGWSSTVIDEETGTPTTYYFDTAMQPITAAPEGEACVPEPAEPCYPFQGCNADGAPVIKFITKDGTVVSEVPMARLEFGECVCPT